MRLFLHVFNAGPPIATAVTGRLSAWLRYLRYLPSYLGTHARYVLSPELNQSERRPKSFCTYTCHSFDSEYGDCNGDSDDYKLDGPVVVFQKAYVHRCGAQELHPTKAEKTFQ